MPTRSKCCNSSAVRKPHATEVCYQLQVLHCCEVIIKIRLFDDGAHLLQNFAAMLLQVLSKHLNATGSRLDEGKQHADGGGFAGAILP